MSMLLSLILTLHFHILAMKNVILASISISYLMLENVNIYLNLNYSFEFFKSVGTVC